jgi:uncharacterized membrane protein YhaH (DUF805 family)
MAYRGFTAEVPGNLKRTVLGTFDFQGRSTRTEFFVFFLAMQLLSGVLLFPILAFLTDLDFDAKREVQDAVNLLLLAPLPALFARRAHDLGQTGWWAFLVPVTLGLLAWSKGGGLHVVGIAKMDTPYWIDAMGILGVIAFWGIALLPPAPEANRYGPNPRLDVPEPVT